MKNIDFLIIGGTLLFGGIGTLIIMAILNFQPFGMLAIIFIIFGGVTILYGMARPLTDEDFTDEELKRMGRLQSDSKVNEK